jgi:hypothetical protein
MLKTEIEKTANSKPAISAFRFPNFGFSSSGFPNFCLLPFRTLPPVVETSARPID